MTFGNVLNIGKTGITGAIMQKLLEEKISVKNFDICVWQEIMDAVKDDENLKKVYTGSTNLNDKNAFLVAKEATVQISDAIWNKVLSIAHRYNGTTVQEQSDTTQQSEQLTSTAQTEGKSFVPQKINLQAEYPELSFNADGDIDFEEYTLEKLKAKFRSQKDNKLILSYINNTNFNGDKQQFLRFEHNGILTQLGYEKGKFSQRTTYIIDEGHTYTNIRENYDDSGELNRREIWNKDNTGFICQEYSNGILYQEITYTKTNDDILEIAETKNILTDKLIEDINKRIKACEDGIGFLPKTDDIENNILKGISKDNVSEILFDYSESTGRDLIQDIIDNKMELEYELQKKLLKHISSTDREICSVQSEGKHCIDGINFGYELQFALKYNDKEMLKDVLSNVNKDNITYVLEKIYKCVGKENFIDFSDKLFLQLVSMLGDDALNYTMYLINAMLQAIDENGGYTKDLVEDFNSHVDSWNKYTIDFTRLINRCHAGQNSTITGKPDGKIDTNNIHQEGTGDCWLLASILSATNKNQKGLEYINNILSVDSNGNVTVELKGVEKKYVISAEEIEKSNHLASGDPDIRAIELAVDKYLKELAYEMTDNGDIDFSSADLNGEYSDFAFQVLYGNVDTLPESEIMTENYNDENKVYSLSFSEKPNLKATILDKSEQQEVELSGRHAETLQVDLALLENKKPKIRFAKIDNQPHVPTEVLDK